MWAFLMKNGQLTKTGIAMIFSAGALVGGALGTLLTREHFEKEALKEIELVREHYHRRDQNKNSNKGLRKDLAKYQTIVKDEDYTPLEVEFEDGTQVEVDIPATIVTANGERIMVTKEEMEFEQNGEMRQIAARSEQRPYLISYEEFSDDNLTYDKNSFTYYVEDDTLSDERDEIVDDRVSKTGEEFAEFFGWRSHDENVVYIRNDRWGADYEIVRDPSSYSFSVLGVDPDDESDG